MKYAKHDEIRGWLVQSIVPGTQEVEAAQIAILVAQGYKPVVEAERPEDTPYVVWSADYEDGESTVAESFWSSPLVIPLDRTKLLAAVQNAGLLPDAIAVFSQNEDAQAWWADNMTYVEGSPMAEAFRQAFGLTLDQIHAFVEASRA